LYLPTARCRLSMALYTAGLNRHLIVYADFGSELYSNVVSYLYGYTLF